MMRALSTIKLISLVALVCAGVFTLVCAGLYIYERQEIVRANSAQLVERAVREQQARASPAGSRGSPSPQLEHDPKSLNRKGIFSQAVL